ncbi:MAG: hypothetical protein ACO2PN_28000 [Pyrobaculum sp.]|jgi:hypothetical protein
MTNEVRALLAAAEDAERRCKKYSRLTALLDDVSFILYISAGATFGASLADYLLHGGYSLLIVGMALWASAAAMRMLHHVYGRKATKATRQACTYRAAEIITEIRKIKARLEGAVDRLEQELERRKMIDIHAN